MKVILLFALLGLSFSWASGNNNSPAHCGSGGDSGNGHGGGHHGSGGYTCRVARCHDPHAEDCLTGALTSSVEFLAACQQFACSYKRFQHAKVKDYDGFKAAVREFYQVLGCLDCALDKYLGTGQDLRFLFESVAEIKEEVVGALLQIVKDLGLDELVADVVCTVTSIIFDSDCMHNALSPTNLVSSTVTHLKGLFCKAQSGCGHEASVDFANYLHETGCFPADVLGGLDLEEILEELGGGLAPLLGDLLGTVGVLLDSVLCTVLGLVQGVVGTVEGVLGGITGGGSVIGGVLGGGGGGGPLSGILGTLGGRK